MRVFLDANILFSAAKSDGAVRPLLRLLLDRRHECRADAYVVAEAWRNLELDWLLPEDRPVLAAAIRLRCDALVTGDRKHFGSAYGLEFGGVAIHSRRSLAEAVLV